jgi:vacuolar-type H+-ATPase subunit F/Vma7
MAEIVVAGTEEFVMGFQLAGISNTFIIEGSENKDASEKIDAIMKSDNIGILVIDEKTMNALPENTRYRMSKSVKPVIVVISQKLGSSGLRESIIKAIGVDLMKE